MLDFKKNPKKNRLLQKKRFLKLWSIKDVLFLNCIRKYYFPLEVCWENRIAVRKLILDGHHTFPYLFAGSRFGIPYPPGAAGHISVHNSSMREVIATRLFVKNTRGSFERCLDLVPSQPGSGCCGIMTVSCSLHSQLNSSHPIFFIFYFYTPDSSAQNKN